ncbi:MAG TPA: hypothetical protein VFB79_21645 [Candidatus Angelobacter sp.]|nr:hypothetical protein [Candidatus Angelobacter sp.]
MRHLLVAVLLIATLGAAQSSKQGPKIMRIGMSAEDLHSQFGQPQSIFAAVTQTYLTPEEFQHLRARTGLYWEVFSRKTEHNEYRILVLFENDATTSRLHPTQRVNEVRFEFDKDMPHDALLKDIAEGRMLCGAGCEMSTAKITNDPIAVTPDRIVRFTFLKDFVTMSDNKALEAIESR